VAGICLSVLTLVATARFKTPLERTVNQLVAKTAPKGQIIEVEPTHVETWIKELKKEDLDELLKV